jgi:(1->4)-alpha-D-glucan 1-alpha-D-glucosylmutase
MEQWPATLLATSTHDGKRSEDVRARIDVISEMPAAWHRMVRRWNRMNHRHKQQVGGQDAPSTNEEYLLYQTLVGTCMPQDHDRASLASYCERIQEYMVKAAREGKARTSWLDVNADYESALKAFVRDALDDETFVADLRLQCAGFAWFGLLNSLSMALIKFASPGVPDLYQENELLALRLVDPDNRVRVDYDTRRRHLTKLEILARGSADELAKIIPSWFAGASEGVAKMWITYRLLRYRGAYPEPMATGDYLPLQVRGKRSQHVVAFARRQGGACAIAVAGRLFATMGLGAGVLPVGPAAWGDTELDVGFLPPGTGVVNILSHEALAIRNGRIAMADLFRTFPGALLHCVPAK